MNTGQPPEKPPMPDQPKTAELPAVPAWAAELTVSVKKGIAELRSDVADVKTDVAEVKTDVAAVKLDVSTLGDSYKGLNERMLRGEKRQDEFEEWRARASERAKSEEKVRSSVDLDHAAQLVKLTDDIKLANAAANAAQTTAIVDGVAKAVKGVVDQAAKNPTIRRIGYAFALLIIQALTLATAYLAMKGPR